MKAHKALRAILFTFILTVGSLLPALSIPPVHAETTKGETTFYFHYLDSETGNNTVDQNLPIKENDSAIPPKITSPEFLNWALMWFISIESKNLINEYMDDPEFQEMLNQTGLTLEEFLELFGGDFGISNPFQIIESYTFLGEQNINITGNVIFHLYFSSYKRLLDKFKDEALVSILINNKKIGNKTITIEPQKREGNIQDYTITLENVSFSLKYGDTLKFSVDVQISNKTIQNVIKNIKENGILSKLIKTFINWLPNFLSKREHLPNVKAIGEALAVFLNDSQSFGLNITKADIANFANVVFSFHSSFIYDSVAHPSSVTIPGRISQEDIRDYFLHPSQEMSETRPNNTSASKSQLTTTPIIWNTNQALERNKILKLANVTASLNFYRPFKIFLGKITIVVTLYDNNISLATSEQVLTKKEIETFLSDAKNPIVFTFTGEDREISYGHHLGLGISISNGTRLPSLKKLFIRYDSIDYPSSLRVKFEETQNIQINDVTTTPSEGKIIPGGSVQYILNVTSIKTDILQINSITREKTGTWDVSTPTSVTVSANNWVKIPVFVNSTNDYKDAYGNIIDLIVVVTGNTGIARQGVSAEISHDAIHYDVEILRYSNNINISKGENRTFYFVIKNNNTGAIDDVDSYTITASSKNDWPLIPRDSIRNLGRGASTDTDDARVVIQVPKNTTLDSDIITIIVTSDGDPSTSATITVTVHVNAGDILESIYNLFDSAAESLGLKEMFGSYGAIVLASILMVIILFLLIILALVFTTKHVRIICTDRIKEIEATEKAIFELTLQNPIKKTQSYEILAQQTAPSSKWMITVEPLATAIDGRQSKTVQIIVTPTNNNESKDWIQVKVHVKKTGKKKTEYITLIAMIKEGKTLLKLDNVSHWPTVFNPGEKVTTSCSILNNGTVSARNVKVFFYLNGKQKNMIEVTIPTGSIADLQIPWMAVKGKNQVRIRLKE